MRGIKRLQYGARDLDQRTGQVSGLWGSAQPSLAQVAIEGGSFQDSLQG